MGEPRPHVRPIGEQITIRVDLTFEDRRRRDWTSVHDTAGRWAARWVRRTFPSYAIDGWSANVYPGKTYIGWWFGSVEVDATRHV